MGMSGPTASWAVSSRASSAVSLSPSTARFTQRMLCSTPSVTVPRTPSTAATGADSGSMTSATRRTLRATEAWPSPTRCVVASIAS